MKHVGQYVFTVAKYVVLMLTAGYIALLLLFVGVSGQPFEEVSGAVSAAVDTEHLSGQDSMALKRDFGLNSAEFSGVLYYEIGRASCRERV